MRATAQKLVILAKAERKQSITLAILVLLALGLWARAAVKPNSVASAAQPAQTDAQQGQFREPNAENNTRQSVVIHNNDPLTRDLFLPRPEDFPPPVQTEPTPLTDAKSDEGTDDNTHGRNSLPQLTTEERVLEESRALTLRSTVVGAEPIAVVEINTPGSPGRVVLRAGESVLGFTLVRVVDRNAVFKKEGVEVKLTLPMH